MSALEPSSEAQWLNNAARKRSDGTWSGRRICSRLNRNLGAAVTDRQRALCGYGGPT